MKLQDTSIWLHHQSYPGNDHGEIFVCMVKCHESGDLKTENISYKGELELNDNYRRHWCGYVGVPKSNPYYGDAMDIDCHGGVTFTDYIEQWGLNYWFIGFDCSHIYDITRYSEVKDVVEAEFIFDESSHGVTDTVKTKQFAIDQVNRILEQVVINFKNNIKEN